MASKHRLESLDPMIFNKLPRLETKSAPSFPAGLCKSSPASKNLFNYKGSYFTCPLQTPHGPEQTLGHWSPAATCLDYGPGSSNQPMPLEGPLVSCLLYPPENAGTGLQPPLATQKGKDSLMQELLLLRENWPSSPLAAGHSFPLKRPVAVKKTAPLAVPKPVYRTPACFMDPRVALLVGPRAESLQQRPGDTDWGLPATDRASHPLHPGDTGLHKRGPHSEHSLRPLHPDLVLPTNEKMDSPLAFSPYCTAFEKYRGTPTLEAGCSTAHSQRKVPSLSPDPWPKVQPPATSTADRERPLVCYPPTQYPPPLHKAALLYHPPPPPTLEPQPYKGFGFPRSGEPFPSSYLKPQTPRSFFPSPLDTYMPRAAGARGVASPPAKVAVLPGDAELPQRAGYLSSPGFAFSPDDTAVPGTSFTAMEPESPRERAVTRRSSAFQPICAPEKVPEGSDERFPKGEGSQVKASPGEQDPVHHPEMRTASPAPPENRHNRDHHHHGLPSPAPVIIGKGNACKVKDAAKDLIPPSPATSPVEGLKAPRASKVSPSSPPMPVINNVFSLAPYRDYLEGTEGSTQVPFCREHLQGDTPPQNMGGRWEPTALGDIPAASSPVASQALKAGKGRVQSQEESCHRKVPKKPKLVPREPEAPEGSPGGVGSGGLASEDIVLDLSLRRVVKAGETQGPVGCTEGAQGTGGVEEEKDSPRGKVGEGAKPGGLPLLLEVSSGDKSNFQSSATFMFKKYKILRPCPPATVPPRPASNPCTPQTSPPPPAPSSSTPVLLWTLPVSLLASSPPVPPAAPSALQGLHPDPQQSPLPEAPCVAGEESVLPAGQCESPDLQTSTGQCFSSLHTLLCSIISCSVSRSSPELLREWLKKAEGMEELREVPKSPPKPKSGSRLPEPQKATKGKEIWLAFKDVPTLLTNLLSQLETFMFARKCPFPHVVRAGAVFIPIHVVKEKLFPKLPGAFVDQVLQEHKVELRPTTLSEEKHLRDLELKSCTSRMLKLLALKQLPDIYPDLLNLHWHDSIRQKLGSSSQPGQPPSN